MKVIDFKSMLIGVFFVVSVFLSMGAFGGVTEEEVEKSRLLLESEWEKEFQYENKSIGRYSQFLSDGELLLLDTATGEVYFHRAILRPTGIEDDPPWKYEVWTSFIQFAKDI